MAKHKPTPADDVDEDELTLDEMCQLDKLRRALADPLYEPQSGRGCLPPRVEVDTPLPSCPKALVPTDFINAPAYNSVRHNALAWKRLRCHYDFEYWAYSCVTISHKTTGRLVPFTLNKAQRRTLAVLEDMRRNGEPIRLILLKARQWGGSTLIQMYMAWIQTVHRTGWNSVICAHKKDTSAIIRGMYTRMLANYPAEMWEGDAPPRFSPFEQSSCVRNIDGRDCRVTIGTAEKPDGIRGGDYAMAHLSETAYWPNTPMRSPQSLAQSVAGAIGLQPYTLVALESTARCVGDYFHTEWVRAKENSSDKVPVFVPWFEIEFNKVPCADPKAILATLDPFERWLWIQGCTTDQLQWFRRKRVEFSNIERLHAEFPSSDTLAFASAAARVFSLDAIERMRNTCTEPLAIGEMASGGNSFRADETGRLSIWQHPCSGARYVVAVDVGGRSAKSDWSVIAVLRHDTEQPEVVAQWRGHIDHDILADKSVDIARYYNRALLVIESNTLESNQANGSADANLFVLNRIAGNYSNMYMRQCYDVLTNKSTHRVGFHTNRATKALIIENLIATVREGLYTERNHEACNEFLLYQQTDKGTYAACPGHHDDILMTRAIALHVIRTQNHAAATTQTIQQSPTW